MNDNMEDVILINQMKLAGKVAATEQDVVELASSMEQIANEFKIDFLTSTSFPWNTTGIASGTTGGAGSTLTHPGIRSLNSSVTANSGASFLLNNNSILLGGKEKAVHVFKTAPTIAGITRRLGFHDTSDHNAPNDGVYCSVIDGVLTGRCVNNGVLSSTVSTFTLSADTWYELKIELNIDATVATFTLYEDNTTTILWTDTVSENIPKTSGRETGHGDVCTMTSPSGATLIGSIDYMKIVLPKARRV